MDIVENIKKTIADLILPELEIIKGENREIKVTLELTNKRLDDTNKRIDDINTHLVEQSRRIDETNKRIDETNKRIDETNKRIDELRVELRDEIAKNNIRIDETNMRIDETNKRIDRLYEVIVRREEHEKLEIRIITLENEMQGIKREIQKLAA